MRRHLMGLFLGLYVRHAPCDHFGTGEQELRGRYNPYRSDNIDADNI